MSDSVQPRVNPERLVPAAIVIERVDAVFDRMEYNNFVKYLGGLGLDVRIALDNEANIGPTRDLVGKDFFDSFATAVNSKKSVATRAFNALNRAILCHAIDDEPPGWARALSPEHGSVDLCAVKRAQLAGLLLGLLNYGEESDQFVASLIEHREVTLGVPLRTDVE